VDGDIDLLVRPKPASDPRLSIFIRTGYIVHSTSNRSVRFLFRFLPYGKSGDLHFGTGHERNSQLWDTAEVLM